MTKLDELINELCPNGVKYKKLKDCTEMKRGSSATKNTLAEGNIPVISGGREPSFYCNEFNREGETITIAGSGAGAGYVQYWNSPIFVNDAFSIKGNKIVNTRYLYHCLLNVQVEIYASKKGTGVPHVHISSIDNFKIPVPPLPIQEEIVRTLDKFAELTEQLKEQLTAELTTRKKQYEYYREDLLTFGDDVPVVPLSEIAQYSTERINASEVDKSTYVGVDNLLQNKQGKIESNHVPSEGRLVKYGKNNILIGNIRPYLRKIWFSNICGGTNGDVLVIQVTANILLPRYLYILLCSEKFFNYNMQNAKGAKMPRGSRDAIKRYPIPLPSLPEQQRIVDILDRFDTLCNDISCGLPAEIKARQQQYEYYRDKLLTFPKADVEE